MIHNYTYHNDPDSPFYGAAVSGGGALVLAQIVSPPTQDARILLRPDEARHFAKVLHEAADAVEYITPTSLAACIGELEYRIQQAVNHATASKHCGHADYLVHSLLEAPQLIDRIRTLTGTQKRVVAAPAS